MRLLRQSTVEPVLGSLLQHYGLRQVNTRGRASAHKTMLLAAMAYNLKKLFQYQPNQRVGLAIALPKPPPLPPASLFRRSTRAPDYSIGSVARKEFNRWEFCNSHYQMLSYHQSLNLSFSTRPPLL